MKKLLIITYLVFLVSTASAQLWVEGQHNYISHSNNTLDGSRPQEKLLVGWKYLYLWGSMDGGNSIDYGGQEGVNFELPGLGVGVRIPLVQYLAIYLEGGYFKPSFDDGWYTATGSMKSLTAWEGMNIYGNNKVGGSMPATWYPYTKMEIDGGFGGEVGVALNYPLIWGINLTAKTGYRYLKLEQHIWSVDTPSDKGIKGWAFDDQLDLSGIVMGVGLKYEF